MSTSTTPWAKLVRELKQYALENINFPDEATKEATRILMFETDEFHPFDFDEDLDKSLGYLQNKVDDERDEDVVIQWVDACIDEVLNYYINPYNFPPSMFKVNLTANDLEQAPWEPLRDRIYKAIST